MPFSPVLCFIEALDIDDQPSVGSASLTLSATITDGVVTFRPDGAISITLDAAGTAAIVVPANDDSTTQPSGTSYLYGLDTTNGQYRPYSIVVPHTGLATLLTGSGPPSSGTGANGNWYLDTVGAVVYQPKAAGAWPATGTAVTDLGGQTPVGVLAVATLAPALPGAALYGYVSTAQLNTAILTQLTENLDGGSANSTYLVTQSINGGSA